MPARLPTSLLSAVMERATLLANHVIAAEPVAVERLRPHSGATLQVTFRGWPAWLPTLPDAAFRVTPAGLVEWLAEERPESVDLQVDVDVSDPMASLRQVLGGAKPRVTVVGDAALAGDVNWLMDNLRWDVQDDLARLVGAGPAHEIGRLAGAVSGGIRSAVRSADGVLGRRMRAPPGEPPAR